MRLPNKIKNNFWVLNWAPVLMLSLAIFAAVTIVSVLLDIIDLLTGTQVCGL
jgi:hypothetical protein